VTKLPRDLTGRKLCDRLSRVGYTHKRSAGDHFIMTNENGSHSVSVPQHKPLKVGTLADILKDVAEELDISVNALRGRLGI
jgi:predicted RNA binding protein YcfA (HicA-like mRNA interferase family)